MWKNLSTPSMVNFIKDFTATVESGKINNSHVPTRTAAPRARQIKEGILWKST
jgi:hypothetical protein